MTYETTAVARVAGALSLFASLAVWGLLSLLATGEVTVTTWALALAVMFPLSALAFGYADDRTPLGRGSEYALGLLVCVIAVSVLYLAAVAVDLTVVGALTGAGPVGLAAAAVGVALSAAALAAIDVRYVERPETAARLEARYLDDPVGDD
ncbi:MAG: hypothetical protein ABEJ26_04510 [Halosimplex sp.]